LLSWSSEQSLRLYRIDNLTRQVSLSQLPFKKKEKQNKTKKKEEEDEEKKKKKSSLCLIVQTVTATV